MPKCPICKSDYNRHLDQKGLKKDDKIICCPIAGDIILTGQAEMNITEGDFDGKKACNMIKKRNI